MPANRRYNTKQTARLLSYLESTRGNHVTVNDICAHFRNEGISVGTTTVYRNLERMVEQGLVAKYTVDGTTSACFEYIGEGKEPDRAACYHCKCESCGKLIHMQCDEVDSLIQHMREHHDFEMDSVRTVFYGICSDCRGKIS